MLDFGYTLDNELTVPVGRLPSGIQTQALEIVINRIGRRYRTAKKLLLQKVPGFGKTTAQAVSEDWQLRLITGSRFLDALPSLINSRAMQLVDAYTRNAVTQGAGRQAWNQWALLVIKEYRSAVAAFEVEVSKALTNTPVNGLPTAYVRVAKAVGVPVPQLLDAKTAGLASLPEVDDPDYLAGFEGAGTLMAGLAGAGALFVGLFWLAARKDSSMGELEDELSPYALRPWEMPYQGTAVQERKRVRRCLKYAMRGGRRRCVRFGWTHSKAKGPRGLKPGRWREDCPGCVRQPQAGVYGRRFRSR